MAEKPTPQLDGPPSPVPEEPSSNGRQAGLEAPLEDVVMSDRRKKRDIVYEMTSASGKPEEFIPRAVLSPDQLKRLLRIKQEDNMIDHGDSNMEEIMWLDVIGTIGLGGRGREDAVEMITGPRRRQLIPDWASRRQRRKSINNEEFEQ